MFGRRAWLLLLTCAVLLTVSSGCARRSSSTVDLTEVGADSETALAEQSPEYRFHVGDRLDVRFVSGTRYNYETVVTPSGTVTVPSGGEVPAAGRTAVELTNDIADAMSALLREPRPNVTLKDIKAKFVFVLGEAGAPGQVEAVPGMTVSMALAAKGGIRPTGQAGSVMVLRTYGVPEPTAYRVDMRKVLSGEDLSEDMLLIPNDVVYVPKSIIGKVDDFVDLFFNKIVPAQVFYLRGYEMMNLKDVEWRW